MREDIRLFGAILGETVREQNGEHVFNWSNGPRRNRSGCAARRSKRTDVARMFDGIEIRDVPPVIRASYPFPALLANVAEDIHRERRRAVHVAAGKPAQAAPRLPPPNS